MRQREPWQHEWSTTTRTEMVDGVEVRVKTCTRDDCWWQMLSRKDSNRYRNGPGAKWMHAPKDCEGERA